MKSARPIRGIGILPSGIIASGNFRYRFSPGDQRVVLRRARTGTSLAPEAPPICVSWDFIEKHVEAPQKGDYSGVIIFYDSLPQEIRNPFRYAGGRFLVDIKECVTDVVFLPSLEKKIAPAGEFERISGFDVSMLEISEPSLKMHFSDILPLIRDLHKTAFVNALDNGRMVTTESCVDTISMLFARMRIDALLRERGLGSDAFSQDARDYHTAQHQLGFYRTLQTSRSPISASLRTHYGKMASGCMDRMEQLKPHLTPQDEITLGKVPLIRL